MLCNLWHIKQTNGLFFYALDYIRAVQPAMEVVVRPELLEAARRALPGHRVHALGGRALIARLLKARLKREWVLTPTSHPFPLLSRQLIVIHDDYPFLGPRGPLKRRLFRLAVRLSGCHVGHINHSTALRAVPTDLVPAARQWYVPNLGPEDDAIQAVRAARAARGAQPSHGDGVTRRRVALFGSDSRKKRYEDLFAVVRQLGLVDALSFHIYGHETDYYREIRAAFPELHISLTSGQDASLEHFLGSVDAVASIATHEGFGRPIALALAAGMPAYLLRAEVFEEFFGRSTQLHGSVDELVLALGRGGSPSLSGEGLAELVMIRQAFSTAIGRLQALAAPARGASA